MEDQNKSKRLNVQFSGWLGYHILISLIPLVWSIFRQDYFYDALVISGIICATGILAWFISSFNTLTVTLRYGNKDSGAESPSRYRIVAYLILLFASIVPIVWMLIKISPYIEHFVLTICWPWLSEQANGIYLTLLGLINGVGLLNSSLYFLIAIFAAIIGLSTLSFVFLRNMAGPDEPETPRSFSQLRSWFFLEWLLRILAIFLGVYSILYFWVLANNATAHNIVITVGAASSTGVMAILLFYIDRRQLFVASFIAGSVKLLALLVSLALLTGAAIIEMARDVALFLSLCQHVFRLTGLACILSSIWSYNRKSKGGVKPAIKETQLEIDLSKKKIKYVGTFNGMLLLAGFGLMTCPRFICEPKNSTGPTSLISSGSPTPTPTNSIKEIVKAICSLAGKNTEYYSINIHPNDEVVKGKNGKYFEIKLKDAKSEEELYFDLGRYTIDEFDAVFKSAMEAVKKDVIDVISSAQVEYKIYIRGSADMLGNRKQVIDALIETDVVAIEYLRKNLGDPNGNQWIQETNTITVTKTYNNKQLPNLRAWYSKDKLSKLNISADILDGEVTNRIAEKDRNAIILLYWPDTQLCRQ